MICIYDCWDAYRAYAHRLNRQRPRGHKLGWRKLNSQQRKDALVWVDRMLLVGGVPEMRGKVAMCENTTGSTTDVYSWYGVWHVAEVREVER